MGLFGPGTGVGRDTCHTACAGVGPAAHGAGRGFPSVAGSALAFPRQAVTCVKVPTNSRRKDGPELERVRRLAKALGLLCLLFAWVRTVRPPCYVVKCCVPACVFV